MAKVPYAPGITVSGTSARAVIEAVKSFSVLVAELLQVLKVETRDASGALVIDANAWYPVEHYLEAYKKIDTLLGGRGLEKIGTLVPKNAVLPPGLSDAHSVLAGTDIAFHMNHCRDGTPMFDPATGQMLEGIGHYAYRPVEGKKEVHMVCDTPYPCRFDQGLLKGFAQRFEPTATLVHDLSTGCRAKGGASCTYIITW
ncbi:hypothetical protein [Pyxidicoccus xibeiensis]|uniref:hypothetical protein n=1 Tax=Pyxidicoccus xibeiensis TaxID=2906759 RepID=UPI0020A6F61F|nr:hypothetical protein [Pyxidicoccus xibeiensis]MCP3145351.1 hypothetical protein [Pyxidicoccus xibeiensis]